MTATARGKGKVIERISGAPSRIKKERSVRFNKKKKRELTSYICIHNGINYEYCMLENNREII